MKYLNNTLYNILYIAVMRQNFPCRPKDGAMNKANLGVVRENMVEIQKALVWHAWHTWSWLGIRRGTYLFAHLVWSRNHLAPVSLFLRYGRPVSLAPNFRTIHYNVSEDCLYSTMPVLPAPYINPIHRPKLAASGRCGLLKIWSRRCCFHKTITSNHVSLLLRYCLACH